MSGKMSGNCTVPGEWLPSQLSEVRQTCNSTDRYPLFTSPDAGSPIHLGTVRQFTMSMCRVGELRHGKRGKLSVDVRGCTSRFFVT